MSCRSPHRTVLQRSATRSNPRALRARYRIAPRPRGPFPRSRCHVAVGVRKIKVSRCSDIERYTSRVVFCIFSQIIIWIIFNIFDCRMAQIKLEPLHCREFGNRRMAETTIDRIYVCFSLTLFSLWHLCVNFDRAPIRNYSTFRYQIFEIVRFRVHRT